MKPSLLSIGGVAAFLTLLLGPMPAAQADLISWSYTWARSPTEIKADAPGTGYIALTEGDSNSVIGESSIVATNLKTFSVATSDSPDVFTNAQYNLLFNLTDNDSGQSTQLVWTGQINGQVTASNSNLTNEFLGDQTQSVILGNNRYTATIGDFTPPGPPNSNNSGSISAFVQVKVEPLPEPGTLALSSMGLVLLTLRRRLRRRSPR